MVQHGHLVRICHGRADYVCQPRAAHRLCKALEAAGAPADSVRCEYVAVLRVMLRVSWRV